MVEWKNVGIIIGPIAATILTTGIVQQYLTDIYEQQNQPILQIDAPPESRSVKEFRNGSDPIVSTAIKILNAGKSSANNLRITLDYPQGIENINILKPIPENLQTQANGTFKNESNEFTGYVQRLAPGESVSLITESTSKFFLGREIECNFLVSYDWMIDDQPEYGTRKYVCEQSRPADPYIASTITLVTVVALVISAISILAVKIIPPSIWQRSTNRRRLDYLILIKEEISNVNGELVKNPDSKEFFTDKVWKRLPYAKRREIISNADHYALINKMFMLIRKRDDLLRSQFKSLPQRNLSKGSVLKEPYEEIKSYNAEIFSTSQDAIEIDWNKYLLQVHNIKRPYPSYLIVPLLIAFSLILTYFIESLAYNLIIGSPFDGLIYWFLDSLGFGIDSGIIVFFLVSFGLRSVVSFFMLRFIMVRFSHINSNNFQNKAPTVNIQISKMRLLYCSIGIMGVPSLFILLTATILLIPLTSFSPSVSDLAADPYIAITVSVLIPVIDGLRIILSLLLLKSSNTTRTLHIIAASATLLSGALYLGFGIRLMMEPDTLQLINKLELVSEFREIVGE